MDKRRPIENLSHGRPIPPAAHVAIEANYRKTLDGRTSEPDYCVAQMQLLEAYERSGQVLAYYGSTLRWTLRHFERRVADG